MKVNCVNNECQKNINGECSAYAITIDSNGECCEAYSVTSEPADEHHEVPIKSEWISTADRLPEKTGDVIVFTKGGAVVVLPYSAKHKKFNTYDWLDEKNTEIHGVNVTHWMPLPERPVKGRETK